MSFLLFFNVVCVIFLKTNFNEKYLFIYSGDKETVLDILGQPRTGENFDRKQT